MLIILRKASLVPYDLSYLFLSLFNIESPRQIQPIMKQIPPIGVTGPKNFNQSIPIKLRVVKK